MENETYAQEEEKVEQKSQLHQVTPLSKYLAMALFVILPFVGGYVGYQLAPERVVEVPVEVERIVEVKKATINELGLVINPETENRIYQNDGYGFSFEYPREYSFPSNINRIPGDDPFFQEYLDDEKSRIAFSSGDGLSFTLFGVEHVLDKEGYGRPVCTNSKVEPVEDCVRKVNKVGTEYFEREVRRNYGWEKGYEFKVNDDLSLIVVQQGDDDGNFDELGAYKATIIDTFSLLAE
jgi:hypothetical protein